MAGRIIGFICYMLCAIAFWAIAAGGKNSKDPISFWSGDNSLKGKVKNVPEYIYMMGLIYASNGLFAKALTMLGKVVNMKEECHITTGVTSYVGYFQLGNVCHHLKKDDLAKVYLEKAGDYAPAKKLLDSIK